MKSIVKDELVLSESRDSLSPPHCPWLVTQSHGKHLSRSSPPWVPMGIHTNASRMWLSNGHCHMTANYSPICLQLERDLILWR